MCTLYVYRTETFGLVLLAVHELTPSNWLQVMLLYQELTR
jgi:hypothetical protein